MIKLRHTCYAGLQGAVVKLTAIEEQRLINAGYAIDHHGDPMPTTKIAVTAGGEIAAKRKAKK